MTLNCRRTIDRTDQRLENIVDAQPSLRKSLRLLTVAKSLSAPIDICSSPYEANEITSGPAMNKSDPLAFTRGRDTEDERRAQDHLESGQAYASLTQWWVSDVVSRTLLRLFASSSMQLSMPTRGRERLWGVLLAMIESSVLALRFCCAGTRMIRANLPGHTVSRTGLRTA